MKWLVIVVGVGVILLVVVSKLIDAGLGAVDEANQAQAASRARAHAAEALSGPPEASAMAPLSTAPSPPPSEPEPAPPVPIAPPKVRHELPPEPPPPPPPPPPPYHGPTFTVGASLAEVEAIQGPASLRSPLDARHEERAWGTARVIFRDGFVERWTDPDGTLHARAPEPEHRRVVE